MSIFADIEKLISDGVNMNEIVVNENHSEWGEDCALTMDQAREVAAEWDDFDGDYSDLVSAKKWMDENGYEIRIVEVNRVEGE